MRHYTIGIQSKWARSEVYAGGKGASVARLQNLGLNIPSGFIITPQAFHEFLDAHSVNEITKIRPWTKSEVKLIDSWFQETPLPMHIQRAISRAYHRLGGLVAVRSSMVGEDSVNASFAGQLDTILNVEGEEAVISAVKKCWASLYNWRLQTYLREFEKMNVLQLSDRLTLAVVIQQMVPAQVSGVAFSVHPLTGESCILIEAVKGLGDTLVDGRINPDRYTVYPDDNAVEKTLADSSQCLLPEPALHELSHLVRHLHKSIGPPQDIEWSWDGELFYILQSRPITSLANKTVYSTTMVSEMLPGLIKPLVWSISTNSKLEHVLGRTFTELIGPNDIDFTNLAERIHSRIYANNTLIGDLLERMGLPSNFFEVMTRDETSAHREKLPLNPRTLRTMLRIGRFIWRYGRMAQETEAFVDRHEQALEPYRHADWTTASITTLLTQIDQLRVIYSENMWMNFIVPLNMMLRKSLLDHLGKSWAPEIIPSDLIRGLQGSKSFLADEGLMRIASQVTAMGETVIQLTATGDDKKIRSMLSATTEGQYLLEAIDGFLADYGFLSASGTDISRIPWIEQPSVIWLSVARYAQAVRTVESADIKALRDTAQQKAMAHMNWLQRFIFERVLISTIAHINLRERISFLISQDSYQLRRLFLTLADQFIKNGFLEESNHIFYLTLDEIRDCAAANLEPEDVKQSISQRCRDMADDAELELPNVIYGDYIPTTHLTLKCDQKYLEGIGGSSGMIHGTARIVLDPVDAPYNLSASDILVVPFTDVSWTPLFTGVGGVIAETGGQLSHSAIIARELGLPAVVNVKNATKFIQDKQIITLDGNQGRVYLH